MFLKLSGIPLTSNLYTRGKTTCSSFSQLPSGGRTGHLETRLALFSWVVSGGATLAAMNNLSERLLMLHGGKKTCTTARLSITRSMCPCAIVKKSTDCTVLCCVRFRLFRICEVVF